MPVAERRPGFSGQIKIDSPHQRMDLLNSSVPYDPTMHEPNGMLPISEIIQNPFGEKIPVLPPESEAQSTPIQNLLLANRGVILGEQLRSAVDAGIPKITVLAWKGDMDTVPVTDALFLEKTTGRVKVVFADGKNPREVYANDKMILETGKINRCDKFDPGWGFIAEDKTAIKRVEDGGIKTVGPSSQHIEAWGNKKNALLKAEEADVPVLPWIEGNFKNADDVVAAVAAKNINYPVIIKGDEGGGGRWNRVARNEQELRDRWVETHEHFENNGGYHITEMAQNMKHIEVQVIGDHFGTVVAAGIRDCSIQKRSQKGIEETATLPPETIVNIFKSSTDIAKDYPGLGTVEFLYDAKTGKYYFMEMNTRPQVEHPVTEGEIGVDLLGTQYAIAQGGRIDKSRIRRKPGHTMEVRLMFRDGGKIDNIGLYGDELPAGTRIDLAYNTGSTVNDGVGATNIDGLGALLVVSGTDRERTRQKMIRLLTTMKEHYQGPETNIDDILFILEDQRFIDGTMTIQESEQIFEQLEKEANERKVLNFQQRQKDTWDVGREAA